MLPGPSCCLGWLCACSCSRHHKLYLRTRPRNCAPFNNIATLPLTAPSPRPRPTSPHLQAFAALDAGVFLVVQPPVPLQAGRARPPAQAPARLLVPLLLCCSPLVRILPGTDTTAAAAVAGGGGSSGR